jgi:3-hydroxybutyryl-CoA dehydratase
MNKEVYEVRELTFSEIKIGDMYEFDVAITEKLVGDFASLSGDNNPIHMDPEYAKSTEVGERIAHGLLISSFFSRLIGLYLPGKYSLYLSQNLKFHKPVTIGLHITIKGTVNQKIESANTIKIETLAIKKEGAEILLSGEALVKVLK